jgi:hypothetical protein
VSYDEQRNRCDYRLQVLCEAQALISELPEDARRNTVLNGLWRLICADLVVSFAAPKQSSQKVRAAPERAGFPQ